MWNGVESHLTENGFQLSSDCRDLLFHFVKDGEKRLVELSTIGRNEVEANLGTFLDEMMVRAEQQKSGIISAEIFESVQKKFPPFWPFCS